MMRRTGRALMPSAETAMVNTRSPYTKGLRWLAITRAVNQAGNFRHWNRLSATANYAHGGGTTGFAVVKSPYGRVCTLSAANNGGTVQPFSIAATTPRTFLGVVWTTGAPISAYMGGWQNGTTQLGTPVFNASSAITGQFTDSAAALQTVTGPTAIANRLYNIALAWNPGVGMTLAVNGELFFTAFATMANTTANSIGPHHNLACGMLMSAAWDRALADNELAMLTHDNEEPWQLFWSPQLPQLPYETVAAPTFIPAWAMGATTMIGAGIAA